MVKRNFKLDDIDLKILRILQVDGRISNIDLSKKVGISPSPCLRRLKTLSDQGIIKGYFAELDENFFGYTTVVFASISVEYNKDGDKEAFEEALSGIDEVREIYGLAVETDYLVKMVAKDWYHYKHVVNNKIAKVPCIKKIRTTIISNTVKHAHSFEVVND